MAKNQKIDVYCFDEELGRLGYDPDRNLSYFQYNPDFLKKGKFTKLFPYIIKRTTQLQVFGKYHSDSFKGLPPMIADSLPDVFGNLIFRAWLEASDRDFEKISVLEQLAYVGERGMGVLTYKPNKKISKDSSIDLDAVIGVVSKVIAQKQQFLEERLDGKSLLNVFKMGSSVGGARPKILVSEHKETKKIVPGDLVYSDAYNHYLVKLYIPEEHYGYNREKVEYAYYLTALALGIDMMPSHLIDDKHFATLRFDRQGGRKQHVLSASGLVGWDFKDPSVSSYEHLFKLAASLKLAPVEMDQLFRRMVFNLVFFNIDDHLKNHSFMYLPDQDAWTLAPAYDLTYSLNPLVNVLKSNRVLSVNQKRNGIVLADVLSIAETYSIKHPMKIIKETQEKIVLWRQYVTEQEIPEKVILGMMKDFTRLVK